MLKKSASFVLGSSKSSTYPEGTPPGFDSPAALLDGHFEHPASRYYAITTRKITVDFEPKLTFHAACKGLRSTSAMKVDEGIV
jgi:hypothetical protein